jgi:hypothetical protein
VHAFHCLRLYCTLNLHNQNASVICPMARFRPLLPPTGCSKAVSTALKHPVQQLPHQLHARLHLESVCRSNNWPESGLPSGNKSKKYLIWFLFVGNQKVQGARLYKCKFAKLTVHLGALFRRNLCCVLSVIAFFSFCLRLTTY